MGHELMTQEPSKISAMTGSLNHGAVSIEQERAIAEAQGQMYLAKRFPRDDNAAHAELMRVCQLKSFAEVAFYSVPRAGKMLSGPSIRLAEEIARCYGNFEFGHRELARTDATPLTHGKSEIEVYAWDKEKNNRSIRQITISHTIDTKDGPKKLRDQKDIDDRIANTASKQVRSRILALVPKWMVEEAIEGCRRTLAGDGEEPLDVRVRKMTQAFARFGVTAEHLERYLDHRLDEILIDELVDLQGVYNTLRDGSMKPSDFFREKEAAITSKTRKNTSIVEEAIRRETSDKESEVDEKTNENTEDGNTNKDIKNKNEKDEGRISSNERNMSEKSQKETEKNINLPKNDKDFIDYDIHLINNQTSEKKLHNEKNLF